MIDDEELKANVVNTKPYKQWIENLRIKLDEVEMPADFGARQAELSLLDRQQAFGFTQEDIKFLLTPMAKTAKKALAPWATTARWPCCPTRTSRCTTTSARCSPR
jgi:glutamate synthase (NADPH/NADH) large chain